MAAFKGIINASFVVFCGLFLLSLFFGRAYCSWFCPGCGMQEIMSMFVKTKSGNSKALQIKYFIFAIWMGVVVTGFVINGFQAVDLTYGMSDISAGGKIFHTLGALAIIAPLTVIFGQFASCKYICWQAPFMITGTKIRDYFHFRGLRLKVKNQNCDSCQACTIHCPMHIDVMENVKKNKMHHTECILCGNCIDLCQQQVIKFTFG